MSENKDGKDSPFPKYLYLKIRRRDGVESLTTLEEVDGETTQPGGQSFYRCKYCGKTFVWPWHLKRHESIHSGDKPHMCQYCGKKFSRRDGLREHERVHTGEKPYECQYCEKAFATATPLRVHERVHIRRGDFQLRAQQKVSSDSASVATTSSIASTTAGASSGASGAAVSSNQQEFKDPGLATFLQSIMGHHSSRHGFQGDSSGYAANMAHMAHMQQPPMQQPAIQDMSQAISPTMNPMQSHIDGASTNQQQQQQHLPNLAQQQQQNVAAQLQNVPFDTLHNSVGHTSQSHNASVGASHHLSMPSVYSSHAAMPSTLQPDYEIKCEPTIPSQSSNGMISPIAHHNDGRVTARSYQTQGQLVHQREQYLNNQPIDLITEHKTEMGNSLKDHVIEMNNTLSLQQSQHRLQSEHFPEDAGIQDMHHQRQHQNDHLLSEHSVRDHDQGNAPPQMEQLSHGHGHTAIAIDHTTHKSDHLTEQDDPMVHQSDHISGEHGHNSGEHGLITQQGEPITEKSDSIITEKREDIIEQSVPVSGKTDSIIGNSDATLDNDLMDVPLHSDSDDDTDQTKADSAVGEDLQTNKDNERNVSPVKAEIIDPVKTTLMQSIGLHKSGTAPQVKVKSGKSKIIHQKPPTKIKSQTTMVEKPNKRKKGGKIRLLIRLPKPPAVKESLVPSNDETGGGDDMDTVQANPVVVKGKTKTVKMLKTKNKTVRNLKTTKGAVKKGLSSEGPLTKRGRGRPRVNQTNEQRKTSLQKGRKGFATKGGIIRKKKLTGLIKARKERKLRAIKNFQCSYCPMMFKGSGQLKIHERVHTGEKPFKCHFCDKTFAQAAGHKAHERIHTGERPYQCNRCEKSFREKGSLKIHQRTHTGEKPFMCSSCGRRFTNSGNLRTHERVHGLTIGEDGMHIQENLYACNSCDKKFQWPWHLKRHQAIHSGDKPHVCPFCGKAYARRDHLREHERSHTGEKPYACKHCEKSFAVACSLRAHEKTHLLEGSNPEAYKERMQRRRRSRLSKQPPPQGIHTQVQAYYDSWRKDLLDLTGRNPDEGSERAGAEQESSSVHSRAELGESSTTDMRSDDGMVRDLEDRSLESRHLESEQLDDRHLDDRRIESRDIVARSMEESMDKQELVARMEIRRHLEARELLESRDHEGRHVDARHLEARELEEQELNAREIEAHQIEARQIEARQIEAQIEARQIEARQIEARQIEARQIEARQIEAQIEARQIETRQIEARHLEAMEGRLSADSNTGRPAMMEGSTARAWGHEYQVSTIDPRLHMQAYEYPPPMHIGHPWPQAHKHSQ